MKINILFAAKDFVRASLLMEMLSRQGYSVATVSKGREALSMLTDKSFDVLMTGQSLADEEGLVFLKNFRQKNKTMPVIAVLESPEAPLHHIPAQLSQDLTLPHGLAPKGDDSAGKITYKLAFFQLGADECLSFNQDLHESVARVRAVIRRTVPVQAEETVKVNEIELNMSSYTVKIGGKEISVTAKEFDLLYVFLSSPNRVLSRPYLIERVWGYNYFGSPRTVDVHIRRLRSKMGKASRYIHTVPCVGYKMIPNTK